MSHGNLLPVKRQLAFLHCRQARLWGTAWATIALILAIIYGIYAAEQKRQLLELELAEASIAPIRQAELTLMQIEAETQALQKLAVNARAVQEMDMPLAVLQAVGGACQDLGPDFQIDSLRMDEFTEPARAAGQQPRPRKQVLVIGSAAADYMLTAYIGRLNASGVFRKIELESSQAAAEHQAEKRSFQIRCEQ
ncbi:MAG: hypothetical protein R3C53_08765 [Pirellulaceae bacterium]